MTSTRKLTQAEYEAARQHDGKTLLFPVTECSRCGGSGHYSYNSVDGTRCYGCNGSGVQHYNKGVGEAAAAYRAAIKAQREPLAANLAVGDKIVSDFASAKYKGSTWQEVVEITRTDEVCGWSGPDSTPSSWYHIVKLSNGDERRISGNQIIRRHGNVDPAPYRGGSPPCRRSEDHRLDRAPRLTGRALNVVHAAIRAARAQGRSLRQIAVDANLSHTAVATITRTNPKETRNG